MLTTRICFLRRKNLVEINIKNVEIMEEKYEIHLPFAFEQEENQSSMKIQNFQAEQDQPNWGQSLGNLRK